MKLSVMSRFDMNDDLGYNISCKAGVGFQFTSLPYPVT